MNNIIVTNQQFDWKTFEDSAAYDIWRANRLNAAERALNHAPVMVDDLSNPCESVISELKNRCDEVNFALYASDDSNPTPPIGAFAAAFGLQVAEAHRSADGTGIVALRVTHKTNQRGYIPYSPRGMGWHTDGYYNASDARVSAFILHCVRPATDGGVNQLINPEVLYIRLRDRSPDHARALMHPDAMTIPENIEPDGTIRPASTGPVFYGDPKSGRLQMRYTARTRSIHWLDDPAVKDANACLREILANDEPLVLQVGLKAGQGILTNNALHNRTRFQDRQDGQDMSGRLMLRVRFHNRVRRKP